MVWKLMDNTYIEDSYNAYIFDSFKRQSTLEISHKTVPLIFVNQSICEKIKMCEQEFTGRKLIICLTTQSFNLTVFP